MVGITEQVAMSGAGSLLTFGLFACYKHLRKTKVVGCLIAKGKTYAERNLTEHEHLLFYDIDGALSVEPLHKLEKAHLRLEVYPQAAKKLAEFVENHKTKKIVVMSSDYDLLKHLGLKNKTLAFIPTQSFIDGHFNADEKPQLERLYYQYQLEMNKKKQKVFDTYDTLTRRLYRSLAKL